MLNRRFTLAALFLAVSLPLHAQTHRSPQLTATASGTTVRYAGFGEVREMRLQVFDDGAHMVFASSFTPGNLLEYALVNDGGAPLSDGTFVFVVTIRDFDGVPSEKVGTFTTAGSRVMLENATADSLSPAQAAALRGRLLMPIDRIGIEMPSVAQVPIVIAPSSNNVGVGIPRADVAGTGTVNRATKWTDASGTLGDSAITEIDGKVGIGTDNPLSTLHIFGSATSDVFSGSGPDPRNGPAMTYGYAGNSFGRGAGFFNVRPDAAALAPNPSLRFMTGNVQQMIITNLGNVGINTGFNGPSAPTEKLEINGNLKLIGAGHGFIFPDATSMSSRPVTSLNTLRGDVAIAAGNQIGITPSGQTLTIAANSTSANTANTLVQRNSAGGFAAGALTLGGRIDQTSIEGLVARGTSGSGTIPATGPGTRLMWYPRKGAFRVGAVDGGQWDDASIGGNSIAMGFDTIASDGSTALGYKTTASNLYTTAMGSYTTASGGNATAMGSFTTASGGDSFAIGAGSIASGYAAFATGTLTIASGDNSTAMGLYASTSSVAGTVETPRTGVFVYGDTSTSGTGVLVRPTQDNQFVVRATGGVLFYTGVDGSTGDPTTGVSLDANGTSWTSISDRNRKEDFLAVDSEAVLRKLAELPVTSWRYKNDVSRQRYIGPMAQDFHGLFGLGTNRTIATLDVDGVTLAGIKALEKRTANLQTENVALRGQLETLILRVQALEANSRH